MATFMLRSSPLLQPTMAKSITVLRPSLASMSCQRPSLSIPAFQLSKRTSHCGGTPKSDGGTFKSNLTVDFWSSRGVWKRAGVNTFRCLVGCTLGDFSAMWFLQANYPDMGMGLVMGISMVSGLATSMLLETVLLRMGRDQLPWLTAARTAAGMSFVSMLGMETVQNLVDYHLTSGVVELHNPGFWAAAAVSAAAGFVAPLPYNYLRLRKYGKACH